MSKFLNIFIEAKVNLDELVNRLSKILNTSFNKTGSIYRFQGVGIELNIFTNHDLEDDMGIKFSEYTFQINIGIDIKIPQNEYWENLRYYMAMYIYYLLLEKTNWKCMIVDDLQTLIEKRQ